MLKKTLSLNRITVYLLLLVITGVTNPAQAETESTYYRIENSRLYEKSDLEVTSFGLLGFNQGIMGHMDLTHLKSDRNGNGLIVDAGFGRVYKWHAAFYVGLGLSFGYNKDDDDSITTYFPEVGVVLDITKSFGLSISHKKYIDLYNNNESVTMLGLVFR